MNRSSAQDPICLVARFLLSNGYLDTLQTLSDESNIRIADLKLDDEQEGEQVTLESLLEERRLRELSIELAKTRLAESEIPGWSDLGDFTATAVHLINPTNVLFVTVASIAGSMFVIVSTADKAVRIYNYDTLTLSQEFTGLHASPVLEVRVLQDKWLLTAGMDGKVIVTDLNNGQVFINALANPHRRYVNRIVVHEDKWLATSGYDKKINLYELSFSTASIEVSYRATLDLPTLPEGMIFVEDNGRLLLVVCARETCFLEYYHVPSLVLDRRTNMNQNKDLWISFAGVDISQQPAGPRYIGLSTSTTPHGRWLAFPIGQEEMKANIFHGAPQSDLGVLPRHVWRPDGSGFWGLCQRCLLILANMTVNSDDGLIRGVELKSGKVVRTLAGHDSAVRSLWTGIVNGKEVLVSGSFDHKVLLWR